MVHHGRAGKTNLGHNGNATCMQAAKERAEDMDRGGQVVNVLFALVWLVGAESVRTVMSHFC